jgi:hypothetical protein
VVGAERARAHHAQARNAEPVPLLQRQAADQVVAVEHQREPWIGTRGVPQPPRPQERGGQGQAFHQRIPGGLVLLQAVLDRQPRPGAVALIHAPSHGSHPFG